MDGSRRFRWGASIIGLAAFLHASPTHAQTADNPPAGQAQPVDDAAKKLLAANGLYSRGLYKLAAEEYAGFLDQFPTHAQATAAGYALAICRYRLNEFGPAVEQLHRVLADSKFDQRDEALAVLGHCELSQNHYDAAVQAFDDLLAKHAESSHAPLARISRAQALYMEQKYADAATGCQAYLSKYATGPSRSDALYFLALSQRSLNKNDQALAALAELTEKFPTSPRQTDALLLTGQCEEATGKLDAAIAAYQQMLDSAPQTRKADALYSLGLALYRAGKYDEAAKNFTTLSDDFPKSEFAKPAKLQLGLSELAAKDIDRARRTLQSVASSDHDRASDAQYGLAQCDIAEKRFDDAARRLEPLLQLNPPPANIGRVTLDHAICLMETQHFDAAADELQKLRDAKLDPALATEAAYRQAFCLHRVKKYDASLAITQQIDPKTASTLAGPIAELTAENLFLLGKYPDSGKQFAALASSEKDDDRKLRFQCRVGQCAYFAGDFANASTVLGPVVSDERFANQSELQEAALLLGDALLEQKKYTDAIAPLERYAQNASADRPRGSYKLGLARLHADQTDAARQAFNQATEGPADSAWVQRAWFERGQIDLKAKQYDTAADAFRRVIVSGAQADVAAPAEYQLGWACFEGGKFPEAATAWHETATKFASDKLAVDAAFREGVALRSAKQLEPAATALQAYASAHPQAENAAKARQLAAACYKDLGRNDDALRILETIAGDKTAEADSVLYDLAWAQRDAKQTGPAEATYHRLLSEHAQSKLAPAARTELADLLYTDKRYADAATLLEQVVADHAADPKISAMASYRLGWCYQELKNPQKAAVAFAAYNKQGGGSDDINASALLQEGLAQTADQHYPDAERALTQMLQKYRNSKDAPVAMLTLGQVQAEQNNYEGSERTYQQFLDQNARSEFAYRAEFGIGWARENRKQYDGARKSYENVIKLTNGPTAARAQFQIGESYLEESKFDQAVPALLAVADVYKYPEWAARALFEAGRAFEQLKQPTQARKQYQEIASKYAAAPEAEMARDRLKSLPAN